RFCRFRRRPLRRILQGWVPSQLPKPCSTRVGRAGATHQRTRWESGGFHPPSERDSDPSRTDSIDLPLGGGSRFSLWRFGNWEPGVGFLMFGNPESPSAHFSLLAAEVEDSRPAVADLGPHLARLRIDLNDQKARHLGTEALG